MRSYWFISYVYGDGYMGFGRSFLKTNQKWLLLIDAEQSLCRALGVTNVTIISYHQVTKEEYDFHISHEKEPR